MWAGEDKWSATEDAEVVKCERIVFGSTRTILLHFNGKKGFEGYSSSN